MMNEDISNKTINVKTAASALLALSNKSRRLPLELEMRDSDERFLLSNNSQQRARNKLSTSFIAAKLANSNSDAREHVLDHNRYCEKERKIISINVHFLAVLMNLLTDRIHKDKISFLPDGKSFIINRMSFSRSLMPRFFDISNFAVFTRALKRLGFVQSHNHTLSNTCVILFLCPPLFRKDIQAGAMRKDNHSHEYSPKLLYKERVIEAEALLRHDQSQKNLYRASKKCYSSTQEITSDELDSISNRVLHCMRRTALSTTSLFQNQGRHHVNSLTKNLIGHCDINHQQDLCCLTKAKGFAILSQPDGYGTKQNLYRNPKVKSLATGLTKFEGYSAVQNLTNDVVAAGVQCLLNDEDHTLDLIARRGHELDCA